MGERESDRELSLSLPEPDGLRLAVRAARQFGERHIPDRDMRARLCIIVEELLANLFDHATAAPEPPSLAITLHDKNVRIILLDSAAPFDPRHFQGGHHRPERGGGAGLALVRSWTRIVSYDSRDGRNRLELLLPSSAPEGD